MDQNIPLQDLNPIMAVGLPYALHIPDMLSFRIALNFHQGGARNLPLFLWNRESIAITDEIRFLMQIHCRMSLEIFLDTVSSVIKKKKKKKET